MERPTSIIALNRSTYIHARGHVNHVAEGSCTRGLCQHGGPFSQIPPPPRAIQVVHCCAIHTCTSAGPLPKSLCQDACTVFLGTEHIALDPSLSVFSRGDRDDNRGAWALRNMYSSPQSSAHGIIQGFKFWQVHFLSFQPMRLAGFCSRFTATRPVTHYQADDERFDVVLIAFYHGGGGGGNLKCRVAGDEPQPQAKLLDGVQTPRTEATGPF